MAEGRKTTAERGRPRTARRAAPFRQPPTLPVIEPVACRFLARQEADGTLQPALPMVDPAHVCVALIDPVPQSSRQQELVCLTSARVNCPRYLRGLLLASTASVPAKRQREQISPAVIGATLLLLAAIAASFAFLAVRGGFQLAVATPGQSTIAVGAVGSAEPSALGSPDASIDAGSSGGAGSSAPPIGPSPSSADATPSPTVVPTSSPTPAATGTPAPSSDRYALLVKCPSTPDCWVYTIRAGDNLRSIANFFGVSYGRMLEMNPNLRRPIRAGDKLRIPTPTR